MKNLEVSEKLEILAKAIVLEDQNDYREKTFKDYYKEIVTLISEDQQSKVTFQITNFENIDEKYLGVFQKHLENVIKESELQKHSGN
ncbi:MAG: hypothetical protein GY714_12320 [Desulfobacterales bacterium]|nr:hypothetical protein [Desulfobacterales bacterium]MCP4158748.1 hypothetical protein [Deltaproteobacteria bacterium]